MHEQDDNKQTLSAMYVENENADCVVLKCAHGYLLSIKKRLSARLR